LKRTNNKQLTTNELIISSAKFVFKLEGNKQTTN